MIEEEDCGLRLADCRDKDLLFAWANNDAVRMNSFSTDKITYKEHSQWFEKIMSDPSEIQYIYEHRGESIGQLRLTLHEEIGEISYSIQEEMRGMGHGKILLRLLGKEIMLNHPEIKKLVAKVKPDNMPSVNAFRSAGYNEKYLMMEYELGGISVE